MLEIDGHMLSAERTWDGATLPMGFESCYGAPPDPVDHRGVRPVVPGDKRKGTIETLSAARAYYKQQLKGFEGVIDETRAPTFRALMEQVRSVLGGTFGALVPFRAHKRIWSSCPDVMIEDGSDRNSPMRGLRPLIFPLDYIAQNPHAIDEVGSTVAADLINRGIGVGGPLTAKLPSYLREKNLKLLAAALENPGELPVVGVDLPAAPPDPED